MVTKEDVEKAKAAFDAADAAYADAAAWAAYAKAADAAADAVAVAAWDKYIKLKEEFENGN